MAVEIVINADTKKANTNIDSLKNNIKGLGAGGAQSIGLLQNAIRGLGIVAAVTAAAAAVKSLVTYVVEATDKVTLLENGLKGLQVPDLEGSLLNIEGIAERTRSTISDTAALYSRIYRSSRDIMLNEEGVAVLTETIQKGFKLSGASAQETASASLQIGQALASGVLQGDELRSLLENAPALAQALADQLGVSVGELRRLGSEGKITSDVLANALIDAAPAISEAYGKTAATISETFAAGFEKIQNQIGQIFKGGTEGAESFTKFVQDAFEAVSFIIEDLGNTFGQLVDAVGDIYSAFDSFFQGLTGGISIMEYLGLAFRNVYRVLLVTGEALAHFGRVIAIVVRAADDLARGNLSKAADVFTNIEESAKKAANNIVDTINGHRSATIEIERQIEAQKKLDAANAKPNRAVSAVKPQRTDEQAKAREQLENKIADYLGTQSKYTSQIRNWEIELRELASKKEKGGATTITQLERQQYLTEIIAKTQELRTEEIKKLNEDIDYQASVLLDKIVPGQREQLLIDRQVEELRKSRLYTDEELLAIAYKLKEAQKVATGREEEKRKQAIQAISEDIDHQVAVLTGSLLPGQREQVLLDRQILDIREKTKYTEEQIAEIRARLTAANQVALEREQAQRRQNAAEAQEDIQAQIDALLNKSIPGQRETLAFTRQINALRKEDLLTESEAIILRQKFNEALQYSLSELGRLEQGFESGLASAIESGLNDGTNIFDNFFKNLKRTIIKQFADDLSKQITNALFNGLKGGGAGGGGGGLLSSIFGFFTGKATGGDVSGNQPYIVGEKGPEIFVPKSDGGIIPNEDIGMNKGGAKGSGASGGGVTNITNNYINAIDTQSFAQAVAKNKEAVFGAVQSYQKGAPQGGRY